MSREYDREDADFDNLLDPYTPVKRNRVNVDNIARGERASAVSYRESTNRLMLATIRKNLADWDGEARGVWRGANLADLIARSEKGEDGDPAARLDVESLRLLQREVRSHVREGKPLHVWLSGPEGCGKTYVAKAVLREFILMGASSLQGTLMLRASEFLSLPSEGFDGRKRVGAIMRALMRGRYKTVLLDGVPFTAHDKSSMSRMGDALYSFLDALESGAEYSVVTSVSRVSRVALIGGKTDARLVRLHSAPHGVSVDFGAPSASRGGDDGAPAAASGTVRDSDAFARGLFVGDGGGVL